MSEISPHDLVLLKSLSELQLPPWVDTHWAVVRRCTSPGMPIGFRGTTRDQRFASSTAASNIAHLVTPRSLSHLIETPRTLAHFDALARVGEIARCHGLEWGPIGSAGFELATGIATLHSNSDLDILLYAGHELDRSLAKNLLTELGQLGVRIDAQVETPLGAVALSEWAGAASRVALRTNQGPRLIENPWALA